MRLRSYIGGHTVEPMGETIASLNPSNPSDIVALFGAGSPEQATAAAEAAHAALKSWRGLSGSARGEYLHKWANAIADRSEEMAQLAAREVGKPISEARGEAGRCVTILRYYAGECVRESGQVIPALAANALQFTVRPPVGVCTLITPWNFPMAIPIWKAAPALAFGNTVILKPAEAGSAVADLLVETSVAAGLPNGVFNVVYGAGSVLGPTLLDHSDALSFTGSKKVGLFLAAEAAHRNLKYQCEMGGKNVGIVLADADLEQAASLIVAGAFRYAGQKCTATSRVVVDRTVASALYEKIRQHMDQLVLDPVTDAKCTVGPVISAESRSKVMGLLGAHAPAPHDHEGFFLTPTFIPGIAANDPLAQEELFAPVLISTEVDGLDEAIEVANSTEYGLSASLFTKNIGSALSYIDRIAVGMVRVNGDTTGVDPHAPFGGMRNSSSHSREQGPAARDFYTDTKTVQIHP